jgi:hypothetical protein
MKRKFKIIIKKRKNQKLKKLLNFKKQKFKIIIKMGISCSNPCGGDNKGLLKSQKDQIRKTLKKQTREDFLKELKKLKENKIEMNRIRVKEILEIIRECLAAENPFKEKFFSIIFLYKFFEIHQKYIPLLNNHQILSIMKRDCLIYLKGKNEIKKKEITFEERYYITDLEFLNVYSKIAIFQNLKSFVKENKIPDTEPVYLSLSYDQLKFIKDTASKVKS